MNLKSMIFLVMSLMLGGGAFSLPSDASKHTDLLALITGWCITGVGMISIALTYKNLTIIKPQLNSGLYSYAKEGFGEIIAFSSTWGYWISALIGNVAFTILFFEALSCFFPILLGQNNLFVILGASIILWTIHFIIMGGIKRLATINIIIIIFRLVPIFSFIIIMIFSIDINNIYIANNKLSTQPIEAQIQNTMLATVWGFIGVEGAIILYRRARIKEEVGKATVIGLISVLIIYCLLSIIPIMVVPKEIIINYPNPSMAYALKYVVGPWGAYFINAGLCITLLGSLFSWTLVSSEIPYNIAKDGILPKIFTLTNKNNIPIICLWITNLFVQICLIVSHFSQGTYQIMYNISIILILPSYLLSMLYLIKLKIIDKLNIQTKDTIPATIATIYIIWLIYTINTELLIITGAIYLIGIITFIALPKKSN